jgi:hypothetical protein
MNLAIDNAILEPGRYSNMPEAKYFALDAVNSSLLKLMGRSAAHCKAAMDGTTRRDTEAQKVGRMIHCAALEPERFASAYCQTPDPASCPQALTDLASYRAAAKDLGIKVGGSKAELKARILESDPGIAFWDDVNANLAGDREPLKADHWQMAQQILESIEANTGAKNSLSGGVAEETVVWRDVNTDLLCKSRMDYYREDLGVIVDIKTTEDASPRAVERDVMKYGYHKSAAHYLNGLQARNMPGDNFIWVFIEKSPPYAIGLYFASPDLLSAGKDDMRRYLDQFAACTDSGHWPGYSTDFQTVTLPDWAQ